SPAALGQPQQRGLPQSAPQDMNVDLIKARMDRLEKQNQELMQQLQRMQMTPTAPPIAPQAQSPGALQTSDGGATKDDVKKISSEVDKEKADKKKADEEAAKKKAEEEGYKVGSDLKFSATWKDGFTYATANNDFYGHIGGWIQYDNVFWNQSAGLQVPPTGRAGPAQKVASGPALGGIGDLEDGTFFRRIRLLTDGGFWEQYEYTLILALENDQFETVGLDEFWIGAKDIPWIGTVRIGHVKTPMGFEADMTASSRTMTFMERSSYSEAIERNENFVTGL